MEDAVEPIDAMEMWDSRACAALIETLWSLRSSMLASEAEVTARHGDIDASYAVSARNLAHYLALRRVDIRPLQEELARMGLSSLGRAEANVLANVDKVLGILHKLAGRPWETHNPDEPTGSHTSRKVLAQHAESVLGRPPAERGVRIMVTLPSESSIDSGLVRHLVMAGMDIARINCAHDSPAAWEAMAANVRRAANNLGRSVRILMDVAGPKLRTGPIEPGTEVLKLRPTRDDFGRVLAPGRLVLQSPQADDPIDRTLPHVGVEDKWLLRLQAGDTIDLTDARGANRHLRVVETVGRSALVESQKTVYLRPGIQLRRPRSGAGPRHSAIADVPPRPGVIRLHPGETLRLTRSGMGRPAGVDASGRNQPACISCTLPEIFEQVRQGERIWFDDGRIGGLIRQVTSLALDIEITHARAGGENLYGDKGINLPDTQIDLPALTTKDLQDLAVAARLADMIGLSFVQRATDVDALRTRLADLGAAHLGVMLKIETRRAFENLPELLLAAMAGPAAGVMIARGDLAVECGYERLAEVQEEILWVAEAAHMPVVWATQVLETLAKTGLPSRAEVTDAAMGERAECVMLNKGPHVVDAVRSLDDILRRMEAHQAKKRPLLRALHAWNHIDTPAEAPAMPSRRATPTKRRSPLRIT
jgi:pyruvate kinase